MTVEKNVQELGRFCNNLGKCFRKLTEDTETKFAELENKIKTLEEANRKLEEELKSRSFSSEIAEVCSDMKKKEKKITDLQEKCNKINEVNVKIKKYDEEISKIKDEMDKVSDNINLVESKIISLTGSQGRLSSSKEPLMNYKCNNCGKHFKSLSCLDEHMKDAHEEETHTCEECGTHFYSKSRLKKHIKMHSSQNQRKCYYFNSDKICPYEALGCKFLHEYNSNCKFGKTCRRHMCPFRHINSKTLD